MQVGLHFSFGGDPKFPSVSPRSWNEFVVAGTVEVGIQFGATLFDASASALGPSLGVAYHWSDTWGLELFGTSVYSRDSRLRRAFVNDFSFHGTASRARIEHIELVWAAGAAAHFSPFAGRIDILGRALAVTPYLALGFGLGQTRVGCDAGLAIDPGAFGDNATCPLIPAGAEPDFISYEPNTLRGLGVLGAGVRLRLSDLFALRIEVKDYVYTARIFRPQLNLNDQLQTGVRHHIFSQIGLSIYFDT